MKIIIKPSHRITSAPGIVWVVLLYSDDPQYDPKMYHFFSIVSVLAFVTKVTKELNEATTLDAVPPQ